MVTSSSDYGFMNKTPDGAERALHVLLPDVPAVRGRQPDDERSVRLRAVRPRQRRRRRPGGTGDGVHLVGQLLPGARRAARLGRTLSCRTTIGPTAPPVAVISSKLLALALRHRSGGRRQDDARVNNVPVTIVGVLPPEFTGVQQPIARAARHLAAARARAAAGHRSRDIAVAPDAADLLVAAGDGPAEAGRDAGAGAGQPRRRVPEHGARGTRRVPEGADRRPSARRRATATARQVPRLLVEPGARGIYDVSTNDLRSVTILSVVVALVLLIVCANVANLLLSRATTRQKETVGPAVARRDTRRACPPAADREPAARGDGRRARHPGRLLGPAAAARASRGSRRRSTGACSASSPPVTRLTGILFGIAPALRGTGDERQLRAEGNQPQRRRLAQPARQGAARSCRSRSRWCCSSAPACSCGRCTTCGTWTSGSIPQNLLLFRVNPQLNRYDEKRMRRVLPRHDRAARPPCPASGRRDVAAGAALGQRQLDQHLRAGRVYPPGRPQGRQQQHQPPGHLAELLRRDGHPGRAWAAPSPIATPTKRRRSCVINESGGAEVLPEREPARPALRLQPRDDRPARDRRRAARREVRQRPRSGAADDVRAVSGRRGWATPSSRSAPPGRRPARPAPCAKRPARSIRTCR